MEVIKSEVKGQYWSYHLMNFPITQFARAANLGLEDLEFDNFLSEGADNVLQLFNNEGCKVVVSLVGVNGILIQYLDLL